MKLDSRWFGKAKPIVIEATALISLALLALSLLLHEINRLFGGR
jgi:hypothetical protein